jgi:hypothetical protein
MNFNYKENKIKKEDYDRFFKKKDKKKTEKVEKIFHLQEQNFPNLMNNDEIKTTEEKPSTSENIKSFAQMASVIKINEDKVEEIIKPGWISIQYDKNTRNRKIITQNGEKTRWMIEYEQKAKERNSIHYRMNKAVEDINKRHNQYIDYYNDVYGEGAYEEKFQYDAETTDEEYESENEEDGDSVNI